MEFIKLFREIIKIHSEIKVYEEYTENDPEFVLSEQAYNDYLSKYLDIVMPVTPDPDEPQPDTRSQRAAGTLRHRANSPTI